MMSMGNSLTYHSPPISPPAGFSNPRRGRNLGTTTSGVPVSGDQFDQIKSQYEASSAPLQELESNGEDASVELSGVTFASRNAFVAYYNKHVLR